MMTSALTLGELATTHPSATKVFHRYGLDFCCGGQRSLQEACAPKGLDPEALLAEIKKAPEKEQEEIRWEQRPLKDLIHHILQRYHQPLKQEVPRLVALARQVEQVHAGKPDCPVGLAAHLAQIQEAVESHLTKEEQILFPLILAGRGPMAYMPVQVMTQEHEDHGQNLRKIREITNNLTLPEAACASWCELYHALEQLERDLMEHIHLENNILFPRALAG